MNIKNNVVYFKKGIVNKELSKAERTLKKIVLQIDFKMQAPFWDNVIFDDAELELIANFGETIKFPTETTSAKIASVLASHILKNETTEEEHF